MTRAKRVAQFGKVAILSAALLFTGGMGLPFQQGDILDTAKLFDEHRDVFERIRQHYPGPFPEVRRIPAFEEVDNRPEDIAFLESLQRSIPAEILILYSRHDDGSDVIEVVVGTHGLAVSGSVVSLIYFESFSREYLVEERIEVFDTCEDQVLAWIEKTAREGPYADAYCRLDEHWYAYQSIT